ncbi:hypothetical protein [Streptomyces sp. HUAS ZL42]|uniref:hypothetical protein n=1 Tax=Streptomyces sp. HUAS ZL42 TaxID=3231715 RepID=UPI00345E2A7C
MDHNIEPTVARVAHADAVCTLDSPKEVVVTGGTAIQNCPAAIGSSGAAGPGHALRHNIQQPHGELRGSIIWMRNLNWGRGVGARLASRTPTLRSCRARP